MTWTGTIPVMLRVRDSSLSSTQRLVVQAVALRCGTSDHGTCWASVATLAADCGLSDRAVQLAIRSLGPQGLRVLVAVPDVARRANVWTIDLSAIPMGERGSPRTTFTPNDVHPEVNVVHPQGERGSPMGERGSPEEEREEKREEERQDTETARATPLEVAPPPAVGGDTAGHRAAPSDGPPVGAMPGAELVQAAAELQRQRAEDVGDVPLDLSPADCRAVMALRRTASVADLAVVWAYFGASADFEPTKAREGQHYRWSTLANQRWTERLRAARAWDGRGRLDQPEQRSRGKPARMSTADWAAAALAKLGARDEAIDITPDGG